ncbi:MAG: aminotransferase class I/II-fold pyridoxal phosphate-dependent enzyme [Gammaproteobacteria bacterium]|nr:aminotransferase class I/II-fold pyridoxal phosphate-dependent enzyme [Gammaproteobacteria bacterium]
MTRFAERLSQIDAFHAMDILARARSMEAQGRSIVHMEIGEPDFPTAAPIVQAGIEALRDGRTHYLPALGLPALRAAIAASYPAQARLDASRVIVTPGASGALLLIFAALINPGDQVLMADPGYPCNRHFVRMFEGETSAIPVDESTAYQLTAELIRRHWTARSVAVLLASPSNPTGALIADAEMQQIVRTVAELGGVLIVDEIYHGLIFEGEVTTALTYSPEVFVVNSFSKYYGMTGWRLGWVAAPASYVPALDKLAQNVFLASSAPAQYAALAAFSPAVLEEARRRRDIFRERRDYLLTALRAMGFIIPLVPRGAFYLYADVSRFSADSAALALNLLQQAGVAITPGLDFGKHRAAQHVRFSYTNTMENLREGVKRLQVYLKAV